VATNTLVLFTGDNGPLPTYDHRRTGGLRGSKLSLFEGGIREPLIAWWPGRIRGGQVNERTVLSALDLLPSLCSIAGASIPREIAAKLDGEDLSIAITGGQPSRTRPLFWEYGRNTNSFAFPGQALDRSPNVALRLGDWKLLVNAEGFGAQLYNVVADPREENDLSSKEPALARKLSAQALDWRRSVR
jgi:arylsulfatase A-like enzyme